jgi:hypothetical protein
MIPEIQLSDLEWRLIVARERQRAQAEQSLTEYISIIAARAGVEGTAYVLDIEKRALVPTYTKQQVDEKLAQKADLATLEEALGRTNGQH